MIQAHYSPYCICTSCGNRAFWDSLTAMSDVQILQHAKGREMTNEQKELIEMIGERVKEREKLESWNEMVKGEAS